MLRKTVEKAERKGECVFLTRPYQGEKADRTERDADFLPLRELCVLHFLIFANLN